MNESESLKNEYKRGEWEMFDLITSAWYGKKCYFREVSGVVFSRLTHTYLPSAEDAYEEFLRRIGDDG